MVALSKSRYMDGLRCPKLLWHRIHAKHVIPAPDADAVSRFEEGNLLTRLARTRWADGVLVPGYVEDEVADITRELLEYGKPLFEAGFRIDGLYCRCDVLVPHDGGWDLVEVKGGSSVKQEHLHDVSFQKHVLELAGIPLGRCFVMHVNGQYVRSGEVEVSELFVLADVTDRLTAVTADIGAQKEVLKLTASPMVKIGPYCDAPRECPMRSVCWRGVPSGSVTELYRDRVGGFALIDRGVTLLSEMPADVALSPKHRVQVAAAVSGAPMVDAAALRRWTDAVTYPIAMLDFETMMSAVPPFDGVRPYQQVPFQWSLHVLYEDGSVEHREYLHREETDPRLAMITALRAAMPSSGTVMAYNAAFEKKCLEETAAMHAEFLLFVRDVCARLVDLIVPFREFWWYSPRQEGSCSIKAVLPAMGGPSYDGLEIGEGGTAMREYARVTYGTDVSEAEKQRVYAALRVYCKRDTEAMCWVWERLNEI